MKPSFALDLRTSTIALLHRTSRGWTKVGEAALEAPDFGEALAFMRSTALGVSPRGITTKLILPNVQILYTKVTAPVAEPWTRTRRIGTALEGLTPYRLDELAYDWCETATGVQVAVVAKQTLEEAETFARDHRFNPVSFVAVPEAGTFLGEPLFGQSRLSKSILAKDETVERDSEAVRVVGRVAPKAKASAAVEPAVDIAKPEPAKSAAPDVSDAILDAAPAAEAANELTLSATPKALSAPAVAPDGQAEAAKPVSIEPAPVELAPVELAPVELAPIEPASVETAPAEPAPVETAPVEPELPDPAQADVREASQVDPIKDATTAPKESALPPNQAAAPEAEVPEAPMVVDVDPENDDPRPNTDLKRPPTLKKGPPAAASAKTKAPRDARLQALGPPPAARAGAIRPAVARPAAAKPQPKATTIVRPSAALPWRPLPATPAKDRARSTVALAATRAALSGFTAARGAITPKQRRLVVLVVIAVLVALLGAVAIWASPSLGTSEAQNTTPSPAPADVSTSDIAANQNTATQTAPAQATIAQDETLADRQSVDAAEVATPLPPPDGPAPIAAVMAKNNATASARSSAKDEIFLAGADTPPVSQDPIGLPDLPVVADQAPILPPSPPPYGANLAVQPAPAGQPLGSEDLVTPEEDLILTGKPSTVPPARPKDLVPDVAVQETVVPQDPSLVGKRPLGRPVDLVPMAVAPTDPENVVPESRFASLRPQARPTELTSPLPTPDAPIAEAVGLASSPIPPARPADVTKEIDEAVAVALNQAAVEEQAAPDQPAPDLPAAEPEAEVETLAPSLPTNASVAKQATEVNALNANRVALLGIFGTQTNRYAMIRMVSGRVKKVQVGDSVEGGRIAGITGDAVKYQKGNRIITLSMP